MTPTPPAPASQRWSPGAKLTPKIILEGTRLTHKTDVAFALNEHPRIVGPRKYRYHSPLISAEWSGFSPSLWGHGLIDFDPSERELAIETYGTWIRLFELLPHYSWIVDRFHLSTVAWQRIHRASEIEFDWLERRIAPLGFHVVLLTRREETFEVARTERLKISGKPDQYDDLGIFVREQAVLRDLVRRSALPWCEVDATDSDVPRICEEIADWMTQTGGLWAPGNEA